MAGALCLVFLDSNLNCCLLLRFSGAPNCPGQVDSPAQLLPRVCLTAHGVVGPDNVDKTVAFLAKRDGIDKVCMVEEADAISAPPLTHNVASEQVFSKQLEVLMLLQKDSGHMSHHGAHWHISLAGVEGHPLFNSAAARHSS